MGSVSFYLPEPLSDPARRCLDRAALSLAGGYDLTPVPTRRQFDAGRLVLTKVANESGYLVLPWPLPGLGAPVVHSSTLRERAEPYHLLVELARGKLNQVRNQVAEWAAIGLTLEAGDRAELSDAVRRFGGVATDPGAAGAAAAAEDVLARATRLADRVARLFAEQLLHTRMSEGTRIPTGVGCRLSELPDEAARAAVRESYTAVRLVPDWRAVEPTESGYEWEPFDDLVDWATGTGLRVTIGPLFDLTAGRFPDWLTSWAGDLPSLAAFMCDFTETIVRRYRERVTVWEVFSGFNHTDALGLTEDDRLRLAARLLDSARRTAPDAGWVVGLAQPWGDYMTSEDHTYSPLVFADTLQRAGFSFAALGLNLLCGGHPRASQSRDAIETFRLFELFAVLGIPLEVTVGTSPDAPAADPLASPLPGWADTVLALSAAVPQVQTVFWEPLPAHDPADPSHDIPPAGAPPVLRELRRQFLV